MISYAMYIVYKREKVVRVGYEDTSDNSVFSFDQGFNQNHDHITDLESDSDWTISALLELKSTRNVGYSQVDTSSEWGSDRSNT